MTMGFGEIGFFYSLNAGNNLPDNSKRSDAVGRSG